MKQKKTQYDLGERLLRFAAEIICLLDSMPRTRAANHVGGQVLRSGTAALPHHAEAQAAESSADFIHKFKLALKELRETERWLLLIKLVPLSNAMSKVEALLQETDQLIRIFASSIRTAKQS